MLRLLDRGLLGTEYTLTEARVLFELANDEPSERLALRERLGMDASFLTRVLGRLEEKGLVVTEPSENDGRALNLQLTETGGKVFETLNARSAQQIEELLGGLTGEQRAIVAESITVISHILDLKGRDEKVTLRELEPGDMGWVVSRHGAIYHEEYGWDMNFEAAGFQLVEEEPHRSFGYDLVGQNWDLTLENND